MSSLDMATLGDIQKLLEQAEAERAFSSYSDKTIYNRAFFGSCAMSVPEVIPRLTVQEPYLRDKLTKAQFEERMRPKDHEIPVGSIDWENVGQIEFRAVNLGLPKSLD